MEIKYDIKRKKNLVIYFLTFIIFLTNLTQLPIIIELKISSYLSIFLWGITFIIIILLGSRKLPQKVINILSIVLIFFSWTLVVTVFKGENYIFTTLSYPFYLSIFLLLIGVLSSHSIDLRDLKYLFIAYILSAIIVAFVIYINYFYDKAALNSDQYIYNSKNSISQILFTALTMLLIVINSRNRVYNFVKFLLILFLLFLILILKSRATFIGFGVLILYYLFNKKQNPKIRFIIGFVLFTLSLLIILNNGIYNFIINDIFFVGRKPIDLNEFSSGRLEIFKSFPLLFRGNELFGVGDIYFENFILESLLSYGILFGLFIIFIGFYPIYWGLKNLNPKSKISTLFIVLSISYFANGFFEGLSPLGPGVKNYFLWLFFGILMVKAYKGEVSKVNIFK